MRLLVVEDEEKLLSSIRQGLEDNALFVDVANNGKTGLAMAMANDYELIITDVKMPSMSGLEMLRAIRESGNETPCILLTAMGMVEDKMEGFQAGADDYLTKPFDFRELLMRINAVGKRATKIKERPERLSYADIELYPKTKLVTRNGQRIDLTPKEFDLLEYFLKNVERVISKAELMEKVWDIDFESGTNVIEVYVNFLRNKIDKAFPVKLIHTQFRIGYVLRKDC